MTEEAMRKEFEAWCPYRGSPDPWLVWQAAWQAATRAAAPAWLPMASAPMDGTEIVLSRGDRVTSGAWSAEKWPIQAEYHASTGEYLGQYETGACIAAAWCSWDGGFTDEEPPTGWMPLPAAPEAKT